MVGSSDSASAAVANGSVVVRLTTDAQGTVCTELPAGRYRVSERPQPGYAPTTPMAQPVTVVSQESINLVFGNRKGR